MRLEEFVNARETDWSTLRALLARTRSGNVGSLSAANLDRLGYLYRRVVSDLAIARRDFPNERVTWHLNDLATKAHSIIYQMPPLKSQTIRHFFRFEFPRLFQANAPFIVLAMCVFLCSFGVLYGVSLTDPATGRRLVPARILDSVEDRRMWTDIPEQERNIAASFIMTNNIQVTFLAFALGITLMLGTLFVLFFNGALLGAVAALCHLHGLSLPLWSFVSPHGFIELSVIFIAGGAGMRIGYALIKPGLLTRKRALNRAAKEAIQLIAGCVPLLVIAGIIEGFVSPSGLAPWLKIAFGGATGLALYSYLLYRHHPPNDVTSVTSP